MGTEARQRTTSRSARFRLIATLVAAALFAPLLVLSASSDAQAQGPSAPIVINELVATNDSLVDAFGGTPDWIELRNTGTTTVNLGGWTIADSGESWTFPSRTLRAGARILVFASGRDVTTPQLHTNFSLRSGGEVVTLVDAAGVLADSYTYPELGEDVAYGRANDGDQLGVLVDSTPLGANASLAPSRVTIATPSQSFTSSLSVVLNATVQAGETARYTVDGSDVSASSPAYNGPLTIRNSAVVRAAVVANNGSVGPESSEAYVEVDSALSGFSSDLPLVLVHADGEIDRFGDQDAIVNVIDTADNGRAAVTGDVDYGGFSGLRVRGASSASFPKKQYKFELWSDRDGTEVDHDLLGLGDESDWGLYAPGRFDRAMINNPFMYELAHRTGVLAPDSQFVEVYLQDDPNSPVRSSDYLGLFLLRETIEIGENRVDIVEHDLATAGADGGYILRYDWNDSCCTNIERTRFGSYVAIDSPKADQLANDQGFYITNWWNDLRTASRRSFAATDEFIDFDAYIDGWLLNILALDVDVLRASTYFHKDAGGQLRAGPLWDFDRSLGGSDTRVNDIFEARSWTPNGSSGHSYLSEIVDELWEMPEVQARLRARWAELRAPGAPLNDLELEALIYALGGDISEAYIREDALWGSVSGYGSRFGGLNGELDHMRDWVFARTEWLDDQWLSNVRPPVLNLPAQGLTIESNTAVNYRVDATDATTIVFAATGLPKGLSIDASTGLISGVVAYGDLYGPATVTITVTDASGASTTGEFVISDPQFELGTPSAVVLNEFNAVSPGEFLDGTGGDSAFGRIPGNGGDWFELVTIENNLDMRGWSFEMFSNNADGVSERTARLVLGNDDRLSNFLAGSIITVAESVDEDLFYNPALNDWVLNLQANDSQDGELWATQSDFDTNNTRWRLVIRDSSGAIRGYVAGETEPIVQAGANVGSGEVLALDQDPTALATFYEDQNDSTFGEPNVLSTGVVQDFSTLRPPPPDPVDPGLVLNEWNGVATANLIDNGDTFFGQVRGNGGDWFELVVVEDTLDVRGWQLQISDTDVAPRVTDTFEFNDDPLLANLRAGTIITVSEDLADDVSFDPATGDWWINFQAASSDEGAYFTAASQSNFNTNSNDWQLRIIDSDGVSRFRAGEGVAGLSGVSSSEVGRLEEAPSQDITGASAYDDSRSSSFGSPNAPSDVPQDFSELRDWYVADNQPPSRPAGVTASSTSSTVTLGWRASTDNVAVQSYRIMRDGQPAGTVTHPSTTFIDTAVAANTTYSYAVIAVDGAGNASRQSGTVSVATQPTPLEVTLSETSDASWSTNGIVNSIVTVGDTVYVGGDFTQITGANGATVGRTYLAAVNRLNGTVRSFNPGLDNKVFAMTPSTDGSTLYVVGSFLSAAGETRKRVAAFDTASGALTSFKAPTPNRQVQAVATDGERLFIGGIFDKVGGIARTRLAAYDLATVTLVDEWQPAAASAVSDLVLDGDQLWIAGNFATISGVGTKGLASVSTDDASLLLTNLVTFSVFDIDMQGNQLFVAGSSRAAALDSTSGAELWSYWTNGKLRAVDAVGEFVYFGGNHTRQRGVDVGHLTRLEAATGVLDTSWLPQLNGSKGVLAISASANRVFAGGEFSTVTGDQHVGLAVFSEGAPGGPIPELVSLTMLDVDQNGYVDQVEAVFDSALGACAGSCTDGWNLTAVPSGATLDTVTIAGSVATLVLSEGAADPDTAVGAFEVELDSASQIVGQNGAQITLSPTAPSDGAGPILVRFRKTNIGTGGLAETGDSLVTIWSEPLLASSLPATSQVIVRNVNDNANDELSIDGFLDGALDLGANDFLVCSAGPGACNGTQVVFDQSAITLSNGNKTAKITFGTCVGNCANLSRSGPLTTMTYGAPSTITDDAGNAAAGAFTKTLRMF